MFWECTWIEIHMIAMNDRLLITRTCITFGIKTRSTPHSMCKMVMKDRWLIWRCSVSSSYGQIKSSQDGYPDQLSVLPSRYNILTYRLIPIGAKCIGCKGLSMSHVVLWVNFHCKLSRKRYQRRRKDIFPWFHPTQNAQKEPNKKKTLLTWFPKNWFSLFHCG